jgi:hypothetical protein
MSATVGGGGGGGDGAGAVTTISMAGGLTVAGLQQAAGSSRLMGLSPVDERADTVSAVLDMAEDDGGGREGDDDDRRPEPNATEVVIDALPKTPPGDVCEETKTIEDGSRFVDLRGPTDKS